MNKFPIDHDDYPREDDKQMLCDRIDMNTNINEKTVELVKKLADKITRHEESLNKITKLTESLVEVCKLLDEKINGFTK